MSFTNSQTWNSTIQLKLMYIPMHKRRHRFHPWTSNYSKKKVFMHFNSFFKTEHLDATRATYDLFLIFFPAYLRGVMKECFHQECDLPVSLPDLESSWKFLSKGGLILKSFSLWLKSQKIIAKLLLWDTTDLKKGKWFVTYFWRFEPNWKTL